MTVTLLGTGTSVGVPVLGCDCRVCTSSDPRDRRTRCACLVEVDGVHILIDAGPDFRMQAMREDIQAVDALLITHHHFDHVAGLDDLRPYFFWNRQPMPCIARENTAEVMRTTFYYIFGEDRYSGAALLQLQTANGPFEVRSRYTDDAPPVPVQPIEMTHGDLPALGYRIGNFAYLTDASYIPDASFEKLDGVEIVVLDALRHKPHYKHFTIPEAVDVAQRIGARQTYFTHMTHSVLHAEEDARLPEGINLGYDGLIITLDAS